MHLHNQPGFRTNYLLQWEKDVLFYTQKNTVSTYCSITTVTLFSGVSQHSVCVTDPHNSMAVEALLTPQINGECSLAGVSVSCCGVFIRSNCFWRGRGTAFSPVRNTALAPALTLLSVLFNEGQQERFRFRKPRNFHGVLAFAYCYLAWVCFDTEYLE